jgi:hypothetical protein
VVIEGSDKLLPAIGAALTGVILIVISCFAPLALFKLLAFTDPTTNSGAALRSGLAAAGGLAGLLGGRPGADPALSGGGGGDGGGEGDWSDGEASADDATLGRFTSAEAEVAGATAPVGGMLGSALTGLQQLGSRSAAIGSDLTNQMGVGHTSYQPDQNPGGRPDHGDPGHMDPGDGGTSGSSGSPDDDSADHATTGDLSGGDGPGPSTRMPETTPQPMQRPGPAPGGVASPRGPAGPVGGAAAGAGEAGVAGEAAAVPIVP